MAETVTVEAAGAETQGSTAGTGSVTGEKLVVAPPVSGWISLSRPRWPRASHLSASQSSGGFGCSAIGEFASLAINGPSSRGNRADGSNLFQLTATRSDCCNDDARVAHARTAIDRARARPLAHPVRQSWPRLYRFWDRALWVQAEPGCALHSGGRARHKLHACSPGSRDLTHDGAVERTSGPPPASCARMRVRSKLPTQPRSPGTRDFGSDADRLARARL